MHTDSMRHLARIYLLPISWVHPLVPFVGHAGFPVTISHQRRLAEFRFPPPAPPRTRPSMSMFTGALSTERDHLTRQQHAVLYQLHPANDTAQSYSRKSTRRSRGYKSFFFSRAKATRSTARNEGRGKEILFSTSRDTISRALNRHVTMTASARRQKLSKVIS